ncbi:MAG: hypothetical protein HY751_03055 [Nitrospinae bacterium]|nr:hypothetical protein [Nitrospinota bacterium]
MRIVLILATALSFTACGNFNTTNTTSTSQSGNVTSSQTGQTESSSSLSLEVAVTPAVVDSATGEIIAPSQWTVFIMDSMNLPEIVYQITVTKPDGATLDSERIYGSSWSFAPDLLGSYVIEAWDQNGRSARLVMSRDS